MTLDGEEHFKQRGQKLQNPVGWKAFTPESMKDQSGPLGARVVVPGWGGERRGWRGRQGPDQVGPVGWWFYPKGKGNHGRVLGR